MDTLPRGPGPLLPWSGRQIPRALLPVVSSISCKEDAPHMALKIPLTVADKQKILFLSSTPAPQLTDWGRRHEEAGLLHDALLFFEAARDRASVERLAQAAVESADLLLLLNAHKALGGAPPAPSLEALMARAEALGKSVEAGRAALLLVPGDGRDR